MPVDVQMNHGSSSAHVQWFSCLKIRADDHDIIYMMSQGSLMLQWEGTIKGEHDQASGLLLLSSGYFNTSVWVFQQASTFGCLSAP